MTLPRLVSLAAALLLLGACGHNKSCKDACAKPDSCSLADSSFSCDENCGEPRATCAKCINDTACAEILATCGTTGTNLPCGQSDIHPK